MPLKPAFSLILRSIACAAVAAVPAGARAAESIAPYQPESIVSGTIRIWGDRAVQSVMAAWEAGFMKYHPQIAFDTRLSGTDTGIAGLYAGVADLAIMGRAVSPVETMAFAWVLKYKPLGIEVMTGGLDAPKMRTTFAILVHRDNPLSKITLAQLDAILGCERRRGLGPIRTWGDLGLSGEWADKPIHAYSYDVETASGAFIQEVVLKSSPKWNWEALKEYKTVEKPDGSAYDAGRQIADALAKDRYGIGVSHLSFLKGGLKPVAVAAVAGGPYYEPTRENLISRNYPLVRAVSAVINRAPGRPVDPKAKEFLRYVLSREGQDAVIREGEGLPLSAKKVREELAKLD